MHLTILFTGTLFLSALLLFLIEPMIAKIVLPRFGGTPAVWNTCVMFFQAMLLVGYAYAHIGTARFQVRRHAGCHLLLILAALLCLPLLFKAVDHSPGDGTTFPVARLLVLLLGSIGLPFFVLSATTPLLQHWYAMVATDKDPYALYAASNLGSLVALLSYPFLVEPRWPLTEQCALWAGGLVVLGALVASCAVVLWRSPSLESPLSPVLGGAPGATGAGVRGRAPGTARPLPLTPGPGAPGAPPGYRGRGEDIAWPERLHWLALAFVPSSLMLGVTTFLTTDIAPLPLLWVLPLALYLLSFVVVFSQIPSVIVKALQLAFPVLAVVQACCLMAQTGNKVSWVLALHLATFFTACMVCHGVLASNRPARRYLTEYYLWMSAGAMLGSMFNVLAAPLLFTGHAEYPLAVVLACLLMPGRTRAVTPYTRWLDLLLPALLGTFVAMLLIFAALGDTEASEAGAARVDPSAFTWVTAVSWGPPLLCLTFVLRPIRFGLAIGALLLAHASVQRIHEHHHVLHRERTFFGTLRVLAGTGGRVEPGGGFMRLAHGTTLHGMQRMDLLKKPIPGSEPLSYYHPSSPIGQCFRVVQAVRPDWPVALIGLGAGSLAAYGTPDQEMTFYEIDEAVVRLARNPRFFTFLSDAERRGVDLRVVVGDARLSLHAAADRHYGVMVIDAFNSDAIPVHLITREALELYLAKLAPDGIIALHITNRYLDLAPVLGNLAADLDLAGLVRTDMEPAFGKYASRWVLLTRRRSFVPELLGLWGAAPAAGVPAGMPWGALGQLRPTPFQWLSYDGRWRRLDPSPGVGLWTDHYTPLLAIFRWDTLMRNR